MDSIMYKELKLSASVIAYAFILFGFMFFLPGYPVLCGPFFVTLGIFKNFEYAREANDTVFSALLPVAKCDVVKGRYRFVCLIELASIIVMIIPVALRMTVMVDLDVYRSNVLMNANMFALGGAFIVFGLFNSIFVGGFFKTAYRTGKPFIIYIIAVFICIGILETLYHVPGLEILNAFGMDGCIIQVGLLLAGIGMWIIMTTLSRRRACYNFERIDL